MPYITTDEVKAKRKEIRKTFPDYKFSVRCENHSTVSVSIMEGPLALTTRGYEQVNPYYIARNYEDRPEVAKLLEAVVGIAARGKREIVYDGDYGSIPNFYVTLEVGKWNRPYKVSAEEIASRLFD